MKTIFKHLYLLFILSVFVLCGYAGDSLLLDTTIKVSDIIDTATESQNKLEIESATASQLEELEIKVDTNFGHAVIYNDDTLFQVYSFHNIHSPEERVENILERIEELTSHKSNVIDSFHMVNKEDDVVIMCGDAIVMYITSEDAIAANTDIETMTRENVAILKDAISYEINKWSLVVHILSFLFAILLITACFYLLKLVNRLFRMLYIKIDELKSKYFKGFSFKNIEILTPDRQLSFALLLAKVLRILVLLVFGYLALFILFSLFPFTEGIADKLFGYVFDPLKNAFNSFVAYLPNLFKVVVIFYLTKYLLKALSFIVAEVEKGTLEFSGWHQEWTMPTFRIVRFLIYAFAVVIAAPLLPGFGSDAFKGVSIFFGVLFSLGSTSAIANLVAGLVITYMRPFKIGDRIKIGETKGDVVDKSMLITKIKTIKNEYITIPNSMVLSSHMINYSSAAVENDQGLILHTTVTIGYDVPWDQVHKLLIGAANDTKDILKSPQPFILQTSLDDYYVSYQLNAYTKKPLLMEYTYSTLHENIQNQFNKAGVEIMSPAYNAIRDGNQSTIPENNLPSDYVPPSFGFNLFGKK